MKNEIKEILDYLTRFNDEDKYSYSPEYLLGTEEIWLLYDYITNLQEENERLKEDMKIKDDIISITYNKDTKEYILDRKNYYKINKRLNERLDYKLRCEKAIEDIDLVIELIKQQPTEDDAWILNKLNGFKYILNGGE